MFKKLVSAVVLAALCCLACPAAFAEGTDAVAINTPEGLAAIAGNPGGSYVLTADIDMEGVDWSPLSFTGTLDGGGHTIYNLKVTKTGADRAVTVDGNRKKYDTAFAGLFSVVRGAVIKDLHLLNVYVRVTTGENCFAAGLAGFAEDTAISGCSVQGRVFLDQTNKMSGVAGLVGFGFGTISGCDADVELVFVDSDRKVNCEEFLGAILATGYADIENCTVKLRGYASVDGYVHNGGVVGMHFIHNAGDRTHAGYVRGCSVDAVISFYEDNADRRAYCKAVVGEKLNRYVTLSGNTTVRFESKESRDFGTVLLPEACENPAYTATVTAPTCTAFGYTTYACPDCGYSYTDDYVAPAHTPGEWVTAVEPTATEPGTERLCCAVCGAVLEERELPAHVAGDWLVVREPTYDESGLRQRVCRDCGEVLEEEEIPRLVRVSSCAPDRTELSLSYHASARLHAEIQPADASDTGLVWTSSDEGVATVDAQGNVYAAGRGNAVITCASADGGAESTCTVTVTYTFLQWLVVIVLFGWIWY